MSGVYISYPFCSQKCTYCNFASGVFPRELETRYTDALRRELASTDWPWTPDTIYLGGGTPSQLDPGTLGLVLGDMRGQSRPDANMSDANTEVTIEAAPGTITPEKSAAWRAMGINRVSLGVQSFNTTELARTGRKHTAEIVEREVGALRDAGIKSINIDLIAGLPGQTRESWNVSLDWIEKLGAPHASVYMLEVDEDSRLGSEILAHGTRYGASDVPADDLIADLYETAVERLARAGLPRYEISNFARPGFESRHNLKYWRREPYLGFGADAHSFDGAVRWQNVEGAAEYVDRLARGESPICERTPADPVAERFFLGLRLTEGIELNLTSEVLAHPHASGSVTEPRASVSGHSVTEPRASASGHSVTEPRASASGQTPKIARPSSEDRSSPFAAGVFTETIERFLRDGLLEAAGSRVRLTPRGVLLSNEVFAEFVGHEVTT